MESEENDIMLEDLVLSENLTTRAINVCQCNSLTTLHDLLLYYNQYKSFHLLRNCGFKTNKELIILCQKYEDSQPVFIPKLSTSENKHQNPFIEKYNLLTAIQRTTLNRHFEYLLSEISVRSYNGLGRLSATYSVKEIIEEVTADNFSFKNIRNIGAGSIEELNNVKDKLLSYMNFLLSIEEEEFKKESFRININSAFSNLSFHFDHQVEFLFDSFGKIKLFSLLNLLIDSGQLFTEIERDVFKVVFGKENEDNVELFQLAKKLNYSKERLRQIKVKLDTIIIERISFISTFNPDDLSNYGIDCNRSIQIIDHSFAEKINQSEGVRFNSKFYSIVCGLLFKDTKVILGDDEIVFGIRKTLNQRKYQNCYIISSILFNNFDYEAFVTDVYLKLKDRIIETYSLHFHGYLYGFFKGDAKELLEEISLTCEIILFNEFSLVITSDNYLIFENNTKKPTSQFCKEILEDSSMPMSLEQIEDAIKQKNSEFSTSRNSLRATLNKDKKLFIYFGRSSTYGLRKWENEKENIKGGTIRDIVEEYLMNEDTPKHISELMQFILKYRPNTNDRSVLANIKVEESNKFCLYSGDFVGLRSKNYSPETTFFKKIVGSHFSLRVLKKLEGWDFDDVINHFVESFGYNEVQVRYILQKRINEGNLKLSKHNKLII